MKIKRKQKCSQKVAFTAKKNALGRWGKIKKMTLGNVRADKITLFGTEKH